MFLSKLEATAVRNIPHLSIEPSPTINVVYGENGSGKTSILEALHLLALGRSFRTHLLSAIIQHNTPGCAVFGRLQSLNNNEFSVGIEKNRQGETRIRISGQDVNNISELAKHLPVLLINSNAAQILYGGPEIRRQFIHWGLFHVEQSFFRYWKDFQDALKQRNAALKQNHINLVKVWDEPLIMAGLQLDRLRSDYLLRLEPIFQQVIAQFDSLSHIRFHYSPGWDKQKSLHVVLRETLRRDLVLGYTSLGPQRFDIHFRAEKQPAKHLLSQGQQKSFACALKLAQGILMQVE